MNNIYQQCTHTLASKCAKCGGCIYCDPSHTLHKLGYVLCNK